TVLHLAGVTALAGGGVSSQPHGGDFSLARKSDGSVWAWGNNGFGQLGDGSTAERDAPVHVSGLSGAVAVSAGESHSLAVRNDGTVWAWGANRFGQLGDGTSG